MATAQLRPALTLKEVQRRADNLVVEKEAALEAARNDLAKFESRMGGMAGDPSQIAATLAAKRALIDVAAAAVESAKAAAANPRLDPRVAQIKITIWNREQLYREVCPLDAELKILFARVEQLRPKSDALWQTIQTLTFSIGHSCAAIDAGELDKTDWRSSLDKRIATEKAQEKAEATHDS